MDETLENVSEFFFIALIQLESSSLKIVAL